MTILSNICLLIIVIISILIISYLLTAFIDVTLSALSINMSGRTSLAVMILTTTVFSISLIPRLCMWLF